MLTKDDLSAIRSVVHEEVDLTVRPIIKKEIGISLKIIRNEMSRMEKRLQKSINLIVDDLGEDVWKLKDKMEKVEKHLGWNTAN